MSLLSNSNYNDNNYDNYSKHDNRDYNRFDLRLYLTHGFRRRWCTSLSHLSRPTWTASLVVYACSTHLTGLSQPLRLFYNTENLLFLLSLEGDIHAGLHKELSLDSFEHLVKKTNKTVNKWLETSKGAQDLHNGCADEDDCLPLEPVQRQNGEQAPQEGNVQKGKVQSHG